MPPSPLPVVSGDSDVEYYIYESEEENEDSGWEEMESSRENTPEPAMMEVMNEINQDTENREPPYCRVCIDRFPHVMFLGCEHHPVCGVCL